jgi:hypothetical protein
MATPLRDFTKQVEDLQAKALAYVGDAEAPAVEYVTKAAAYVAGRLPHDRPEQLTGAIDTVLGQVDFAKKALDAQVDFVKAVLDAAAKPFKPARRPTATKAAKAA